MLNSIDSVLIEELKELMEEDFPELIQTYVSDSEIRLTAIKAAIDSKDSDSLREQAHGLKGSSSNLGAEILADISYQLETAGRTNNLEQAEVVFEKLKGEFLEVQKHLSSLVE